MLQNAYTNFMVSDDASIWEFRIWSISFLFSKASTQWKASWNQPLTLIQFIWIDCWFPDSLSFNKYFSQSSYRKCMYLFCHCLLCDKKKFHAGWILIVFRIILLDNKVKLSTDNATMSPAMTCSLPTHALGHQLQREKSLCLIYAKKGFAKEH